MWVTDDGRTNTVGLRDPSYVLSDVAFDTWNRLVETVDEAQVERVLTQRFEAVLDAYPHEPDQDSEYVDAAPPPELVDTDLSTIERLEMALDGVETRWYLDVVIALTELFRFPERVEYE
jgi:hypothetical protein